MARVFLRGENVAPRSSCSAVLTLAFVSRMGMTDAASGKSSRVDGAAPCGSAASSSLLPASPRIVMGWLLCREDVSLSGLSGEEALGVSKRLALQASSSSRAAITRIFDPERGVSLPLLHCLDAMERMKSGAPGRAGNTANKKQANDQSLRSIRPPSDERWTFMVSSSMPAVPGLSIISLASASATSRIGWLAPFFAKRCS